MSRRAKKKAVAVRSSAPVSPAGEIPEVGDFRSLKSESYTAGLNDRWLVPGICIFLAAITFAVFVQTLRHEFVNYDDDVYVYENPEVSRGLTLQGIVWAFTHVHSSNWHPLTWISHMLDCQLYGLSPGGHHLTNILLHTATAILLFLVLRRMSGALWRSAFVAAVFAIHPLRVESVAWVAERKDVLSGVFFMLTIGAYVRYVQKQSRVEPSSLRFAAPESRGSRAQTAPAPGPRLWTLDYCLVLLFFALGLMCKPMLVTLPFVLLLLDYWPLNRLRADTATEPIFRLAGRLVPRRLVFEKLPLFGLAVASGVVTIYAQTGAIQSFEHVSLPLRMGNALMSYVDYLGQMFWPAGLAVLYPFTAGGVGVSGMVLSLVLLAGISAGVFALRRRPYFLTGWLWYLLMLVPVIGIVQVGAQARADRYTYLPQIGLYLLSTWAAADLCAGWRHRRAVLGGCATVILVALIFCARVQTSYWRNSESLWTHTLACTFDNFIGHTNLGNALLKMGNVNEAIAHYQKALQIKPDSAEAHNNLGNALIKKGSVDEAIAHYQKALQIKPDYAETHNNLGNALLKKGSVDEAIVHFQKALQIKPDFAEAYNNLGDSLLKKGSVDEAITHFQKALQIKPGYAEAHYNLGNALNKKGSVDEAITHFQKAVQIKSDYAEAYNNLGDALLKKGGVDEAIVHFQKALQIKPDFAEAHYNLGDALIKKGSVDEAIVHFQKALQIKPDYAEAHNNLGNALFKKGSMDEAITHYQKALQIKSDYAKAHINLGNALLQKGNVAEAITHFQKALQIKPDDADARNNLGKALRQKGKVDEATAH
jgi:tetratricopeptide (TPR) repeat protein